MLSSHQLGEVQEICSHVAIIDRGRLRVTGPISDIIGDGRALEIGVDRPAEALDFLQALPDVQEARLDDGRMIAIAEPGPEGAPAAAINRALVEAGFEVHLIRPHEDMLEARFLELTSTEDREAGDDAA